MLAWSTRIAGRYMGADHAGPTAAASPCRASCWCVAGRALRAARRLRAPAMARRSRALSSIASSTPCSRATSRRLRPEAVASLTMAAARS